jgi:hypothetical protein
VYVAPGCAPKAARLCRGVYFATTSERPSSSPPSPALLFSRSLSLARSPSSRPPPAALRPPPFLAGRPVVLAGTACRVVRRHGRPGGRLYGYPPLPAPPAAPPGLAVPRSASRLLPRPASRSPARPLARPPARRRRRRALSSSTVRPTLPAPALGRAASASRGCHKPCSNPRSFWHTAAAPGHAAAATGASPVVARVRPPRPRSRPGPRRPHAGPRETTLTRSCGAAARTGQQSSLGCRHAARNAGCVTAADGRTPAPAPTARA